MLRRFVFGPMLVGFALMLPVIITYIMLGQIFDLTLILTVPIMDVLPGLLISDVAERRVVAVALLALIFWLVGAFSATEMGRRLGRWIEANTLDKFPPYGVLRSFSRRLTGHDVPSDLKPVLVETHPGTQVVGFVVEEVDATRTAIFVPLAPTPGVGFVHIVANDRIEVLQARFTDSVGVLFNWGAGAKQMMSADLGAGAAPR